MPPVAVVVRKVCVVVEIGKVERHIDLDIAETQRSVYIIDIDAAAVRAMPDGARILARNAARGVRTPPLPPQTSS